MRREPPLRPITQPWTAQLLGRIESTLRRLRRKFSRSEWLARLLKLPVVSRNDTEPGLVLVQIDGLSHTQLQSALKKGEMPFLRRLIQREHYRLHRQYAGVPSTTSAVQAELFYGIKTAVPGFNFMKRSSGKLVRMIEPEAAADVEGKLAKLVNRFLLKGGSAYVDNYTGGAAEAHFCPTALGWGPSLREASPAVVLFLIMSNLYSFLRMAALLVLEVFLAFADFIRSLNAGHDLWAELKFVPARAVIAILFRELAVIGAKIDMVRGLPIIHLNFLGYDEQAHRRGPSSKFAHWTLKGIDDAVARLWRAAHRSVHRHYDVWIYSDHGQQDVQSYSEIYGMSLAEAVSEVCLEQLGKPLNVQSNGVWGVQLHRVQFLGGKRIQKLLAVQQIDQPRQDSPDLTVAALGPVAMIYENPRLPLNKQKQLARALVTQAKIPLVLIKMRNNRARAYTEAGEFILPQDRALILGADHPFLEECTRDLIGLCHHPDAGDILACGWRSGSLPYSFAIERGAHGGISPEETTAFSLLNKDAPLALAAKSRGYLYTLDLRLAALKFLGRQEVEANGTEQKKQSSCQCRVMTYNIHSCIGMDGKLAPERIARIIAAYRPDVVALQEVDAGRARTGHVDQAGTIAACLDMNFEYLPTVQRADETYGIAILSRYPMTRVKSGLLPGLSKITGLEPRGALWVEIDCNGTKIQVINTHFGLSVKERAAQTRALLGSDWLARTYGQSPVIVCGDLNARARSRVYRQFSEKYQDVQLAVSKHLPRGTFFGRFPMARIDHIFTDRATEVLAVEVPSSELCRLASDHLPLLAELRPQAKTRADS